MAKYRTALIIIILLITLSACEKSDIRIKDVTLERIEQTVEVVAAKTRASIEDSIQNSEISSDPEVKIKKDIEWTETDEQWKNRRTKSNSTLQVTIERTDRSMVNDDGLTIASIYYDRPVVSGDTVAAEKITQFFEDEEQDWFAGRGRLLHIPGNDLEECPEINVLDIICEDIGKMRERYGDEDVQNGCAYIA